jgi:anti-sigma factor ChrR (cupin superfamily)
MEDSMRQDTRYLNGEPTTEPLLVLDPFGIERIAWKPVVGCRGVFEKELRRAGDVVCALIRYEPGARTPGHRHTIAEHHIWVIAGRATIGGREFVAGSYAHVPATAEHPIAGVGPEGCMMLQLHHRCPSEHVQEGSA